MFVEFGSSLNSVTCRNCTCVCFFAFQQHAQRASPSLEFRARAPFGAYPTPTPMPKAGFGGRFSATTNSANRINHCSVCATRSSPGDQRSERDIGMRYSLLFCYPLAFNALDGGFSWDDLRKILHGCERMAKIQNSEEILPKVSTP